MLFSYNRRMLSNIINHFKGILFIYSMISKAIVIKRGKLYINVDLKVVKLVLIVSVPKKRGQKRTRGAKRRD